MKSKNSTISNALLYHMKHDLTLSENIFRYGSKAWGAVIREARALYNNGELDDLDFDDYKLLESDMAEIATFQGKEVLLDTPETNWDKEGWTYVYVREGNVVKRVDMDLVTEEAFVTI